MDSTPRGKSQPVGPFRTFTPQSVLRSPSAASVAPHARQQSRNSPQGAASNTVSPSRSSSQRAASTLASSFPSHADDRPQTVSVDSRSSSKQITSSHQEEIAVQVTDEQLAGPSPHWAYFYDPPLSLRQVDFVQERMKPEEEYSRMPSSDREKAMVSDLKNALSSMRRAFNRSTDVRGPTTTSSSATTTAKATQSMLGYQGASAESAGSDPIAISSDDDTVDEFEVDRKDAAQPETTAPSKVPPHRASLNQPTGLNDIYTSGKRESNEDDVRPKRAKTSQVYDHNTATRKAASPGHTAEDIADAGEPAAIGSDLFIGDMQNHTADSLRDRTPSEQHKAVSIINKLEEVLGNRQLPDPTGRAEELIKTTRQDAGTSAARDGIDSDAGDQPKRRGRKPKLRHPEGLAEDLEGRPYHLVKNKWGAFENRGFLLPGRYSDSMPVGSRVNWVCPIRSCRYAFMKMSTLGKHWRRSHRRCLLNDNNDGTFSIKGEYEPKKPRSANALVISRDPLNPNEPPMAATRSYRQTLLELGKQRDQDHDQGEDGTGEISGQSKKQTPADDSTRGHDFKPAALRIINDKTSAVVIPSDPAMATELRAYTEWPDDTGKLVNTKGAWLPANYENTEYPDFEWICPIRSCRRVTQSLSGLGGHFNAMHHSTTLNDNRDGTFSELGHYTSREEGHKTRPPVVKSKTKPSNNTQLVEPNVGPNDARRRKLFDASLTKLRLMAHDEAKAGGQTIDEMMADGMLGQKVTTTEDLDVAQEPDAMSVSNSKRLPAEPDTSEGEGPEQAESSNSEEDQDKPSGELSFETPAAEENWKTIQDFFTVRKFPPPQSDPLKALMARPRVRDIILRTTNLKFCISWPKDVAMLIVQLVGRQSPRPCSRCARGAGVFLGCVILDQKVADLLQSGVCSCVNCAWKSLHFKSCDLKQVLKEEARRGLAAASTSQAPNSAQADLTADKVNREDDPSHQDRRPLRARRSERLLLTDESERQTSEPRGQTPAEPQAETRKRDPRGDDDTQYAVVAAAGTVMKPSQQLRTTRVDDNFAFGVEVIPHGTALRLDADTEAVRICTLASGKVAIRVAGEPAFKLGSRGMFRLAPGVWGEVMNSAGVDAVLHVSSVRTGR